MKSKKKSLQISSAINSDNDWSGSLCSLINSDFSFKNLLHPITDLCQLLLDFSKCSISWYCPYLWETKAKKLISELDWMKKGHFTPGKQNNGDRRASSNLTLLPNWFYLLNLILLTPVYCLHCVLQPIRHCTVSWLFHLTLPTTLWRRQEEESALNR